VRTVAIAASSSSSVKSGMFYGLVIGHDLYRDRAVAAFRNLTQNRSDALIAFRICDMLGAYEAR
jgi:hypothetical protein